MQHPRHPLHPETLQVIEQRDAYFNAVKPNKTPKPAPDLSPLDQMFAYYDAT